LSKNLLREIQIPVSKDSGSKRKFTMELAEVGKSEIFTYAGKHTAQCSLSVISKELSSLLAVNPKELIDCLTDLFDSHDVWEYGTRGQDEDILYNVCVNLLAATTPTSFAENLPASAIGGGFTSRCLIIYATDVYKRIPRPSLSDKQRKLYTHLVHDLHHISQLVGEFSWDPEAEAVFDPWYEQIDKKISEIKDERVKPFLGRIHAVVLKTAMCYRVDYSDTLILTKPDIETAIEAVEQTLHNAHHAFGGHGSTRVGTETYKILQQLKLLGTVSFRELLRYNYRNTTKTELELILQDIKTMGLCSSYFDTVSGDEIVTYKPKALVSEYSD
jgi:hypothetical protein